MAFLIVVVILGVIGMFCAAGWYAIGSSISDGRKVRELDPAAICAQLFDGSPQVVYAPRARHGGLPLPALIQGANAYGYRLVSESGQMATRTVVFAKV